MKKIILLIFSVVLFTFCSEKKKAPKDDSIKVSIKNGLNADRREVISAGLTGLSEAQKKQLSTGIGRVDGTPVELTDADGDGVVDRMHIIAEVAGDNSVTMDLTDWAKDDRFKKLTQAELSVATGGAWNDRKYENRTGFKNVSFLSVPASHTDHSYFVRYEGPGWENDLVGYRAYLDWRNAIDIWGKKVDTLVLQDVGQDGFDSYHEEEDWGMDILKVGPSLGIGSMGRMNAEGVIEKFKETDSVTCEILKSGYLSSSVETRYYGWKTGDMTCDLTSVFTIAAGDRATEHTVSFDKQVSGFCTGIVKHPSATYSTKESGSWGYIATFGAQTLFDDQLGMAVFYRLEDVAEIQTDDDYSYVVLFQPTDKLQYHFMAVWEGDKGGIKDEETFNSLLDEKLAQLNNPLQVTIQNSALAGNGNTK